MASSQQASKAFFADPWILQDHQVSIGTGLKHKVVILQDHQVSISTRLKHKVALTVACFAPGHRALYKNGLVNMDVLQSRCVRSNDQR